MDCAAVRPPSRHHDGDGGPYQTALWDTGYLDDQSRTPRPSHTMNVRPYDFDTQAQQGADSRMLARPVQIGRGSHEGFHGRHSSLAEKTSENMLRRKTPNGVLNDAYQGSIHDVNPMKHIILPSPQPSSYQQGRPRLPQVDSFLQQTSSRLPLYPNPYGRTVPSVMQPSFQYLGPTASGTNGAGPYGPYWHDGTYIPYRPTAIRDPRHYGDAGQAWTGTAAGSQVPSQLGTWSSPYAGPIPQTGYNSFGFAHPAVPQNAPAFLPLGMSVRSPVIEFGSGSTNAQQRERTFTWALQTYRELLASHHRMCRRTQHANSGQDLPAPVRHNYFPKPPAPSSGHVSATVMESADDATLARPVQPGRRTSSAISTHRSGDVQVHRGSVDAYSFLSQPSIQTLRDAYYRAPSSHHNTSSDHCSAPRASSKPSDPYNTLRRSSSANITPPGPPCSPEDAAQMEALSAVTVLTKLCQQTSWQWVDGLHLGGCLAYALGDYKKAYSWYTKVLDLDPRHLEAISNLAATLHALGRKQEAELYYSKVVKLAPGHFEAVEHLVGLLCSANRGKEAIKVIDYVERSLRQPPRQEMLKVCDRQSDCSSMSGASPGLSEASDAMHFDFDVVGDRYAREHREMPASSEPGFGSSGYNIPGSENGRILALVHAKGNMLYSSGDNAGAARAFEEAVLIAAGRRFDGIRGLVKHVLSVISVGSLALHQQDTLPADSATPVLLHPEQAVQTARLCFAHFGELPGLGFIAGEPQSLAKKAAVSTTSNSLLSLAKIFQDSMSASPRNSGIHPLSSGVRDILALYYLSLSLQPSPSTANNVGILLAGVQQSAPPTRGMAQHRHIKPEVPGVVPGSGIALALAYYNYGLLLDSRHAHLYTNLGSLLKDIGQLDAAIEMYGRAVQCDPNFDIALANLANAVKDKGRISDAIEYYRRAVDVSPHFAEAVCGLANALNSVCNWQSRGGIVHDAGKRDRWHVDENGMLLDATQPGAVDSGWIKRVVDTVEKQLADGEDWGKTAISPGVIEEILQSLTALGTPEEAAVLQKKILPIVESWVGKKWEGARIMRLVERITRRIGWQWYQDKHVNGKEKALTSYKRPRLPVALTVPPAPTVLPFHTFTCPVSAKQVRLISQRNGYRISAATLRTPWLPSRVFTPPLPPNPQLKVGYISSDFNNHPLAHLMQSVFGLHATDRVEAFCYATTASDNSVHRRQIEAEAPVFHDACSWSTERLVNQIVQDGIHILVNLNGYTRGARNEVFAARPAPIQMSFMGFAGTLGAEWCDYLLADDTAIPVDSLRPWRGNVAVEDQIKDENSGGDQDEWVYGENIIFCRDTFFCCDHKQSAPDSQERRLTWDEEQTRRWHMRKETFPTLADDAIIFGNFNQLYKIDPTTFRTWLRVLARVPKSILWLLRFPDLGEGNLLRTARQWAGPEVASRVIFTDVAPKNLHISRARICDLFLDTPECNAHTTAADILWSGTPLLTLPRYKYKMCSRMAASILKGALPKEPAADRAQAEQDLIASTEEEYEDMAVKLGNGLKYPRAGEGQPGIGQGRLMELRKMLTASRWSSALFDTKRWVSDLDDAYEEAWRRWVAGEGGDIWLDRVPRGGAKRENET